MIEYKVYLWPGFGYVLQEKTVYARDPEDALVQASFDIGHFVPFDKADDDIIAAEDTWTYLDRTEHNGGVGYLLIENAIIKEAE